MARIGCDIKNLSVHSNRILRAGLDAEAAVNAFAEINDETFGTLLNIRVGMPLGLNVDTSRGADGLAHHAGHAARRAVFALREAVAGAGARRKRPGLLRPLEGDGRTDMFREPSLVKDMNREIPKEMTRGDCDPQKNLGKVELFPERKFGTPDDLGLNRHDPILTGRL